MRLSFMLVLAFAGAILTPLAAQKSLQRTPLGDLEFRPTVASEVERFEILLPDIASGRSQRRAITDMLLRVSLPGGDVGDALRVPNGTVIERATGLFKAYLYVVSGGKLLPDVEARCDHWSNDITICKVGCDGGVFGLKRRPGFGPSSVSLVAGELPRGNEDGAKPGFNLNACQQGGAIDVVLAPVGGRSVAEIGFRAR